MVLAGSAETGAMSTESSLMTCLLKDGRTELYGSSHQPPTLDGRHFTLTLHVFEHPGQPQAVQCPVGVEPELSGVPVSAELIGGRTAKGPILTCSYQLRLQLGGETGAKKRKRQILFVRADRCVGAERRPLGTVSLLLLL
ncbi:hypothetical protein SRHO_G00090880 [Serrasalmus rhombeus]